MKSYLDLPPARVSILLVPQRCNSLTGVKLGPPLHACVYQTTRMPKADIYARALLVSDGSEDKAMEGEPPRIVTRKIKT